ncbi:MAG TPA: hypothetical protein VHB98_06400 [Chloroflexota bacterium]|nr:hypothetical protein [Chloroflexota bacterium]
MAQVNVNDSGRRPPYADESTYANTPANYGTTPPYDNSAGARTAATSNLTWAIAVVLIIAALAIAIVYVTQNVHF